MKVSFLEKGNKKGMNIMNYVFRLTKGQDLKKEMVNYVKQKNIKAGIVKCGVGCVYEAKIRLADGHTILHKQEQHEIVSLMGTVSINGVHIHIALSDKDGHTIGGHLVDGCLVNTTAEICLEELENYTFTREFDKNTGYDELVIK